MRGDLPEIELSALESSLSKHVQPRLLPTGKAYCAELSKTIKELGECAGDLEDVVAVSNYDKAQIREIMTKFKSTVHKSRKPCGKMQKLFRRCKK